MQKQYRPAQGELIGEERREPGREARGLQREETGG